MGRPQVTCLLFLLITMSLTIVQGLSAQSIDNKIDSLYEAVSQHNGNVGQKQNEFRLLGSLLEKEGKLDDAREIYHQALTFLAKEPHLQTVFFNRLVVNYWQVNEYDSAQLFSQKAIDNARAMAQNELLADALVSNGLLHYQKGNYGKAISSYSSALKEYQHTGTVYNRASANLNLGIAYKKIAYYDKAIHHLYLSSDLFGEIDNLRYQSSAFNSLADTYNEMSDYPNALAFHEKALTLRKSLADQGPLASSLNNLGNVYQNLDSPRIALNYYEQALAIRRKENDRQRISSTLENIGALYFKLGEMEKAQSTYDQALALAVEASDRLLTATLYNKMANLALENTQYEKAKSYLQKGRRLSQEMQTLEILRRNYELSSELHERLGNQVQALSFFKQQSILRDSIMNKEKLKALTEMEVKYETDQKEKDIETLSQQASVREQLLSQQRITIYALFSAALLLLLLAFIAYNRYLLKNKANSYIRHLMDELNHRVKNNLQVISSLLKIQSYEVDNDLARDVMMESRNRVGAMALIHQKLYQQDGVSSVDMKEYLTDLVGNLASSFGYDESNAHITIESHDLHLDVDSAIPIGLIINELSCNALKYAFTPDGDNHLSISLKESGNELQLKVKDNGPNPTSLDSNTDSFGLSLVRSFGKELEAEIRFNYDGGTEVSLSIKRYKIPDRKLQRLLRVV